MADDPFDWVGEQDESETDADDADVDSFREHRAELRKLSATVAPENENAESDRFLVRLWRGDAGVAFWLNALLSISVILVVTGGLLFIISGTWPLVVGVETGSMEPNIAKGDLVVLTAPDRFAPAAADTGIGIITHEQAKETGVETFGGYGSVVVFASPNSTGPPTIHRVHFTVNEGENWVAKANESFLPAANCPAIEYCPAPHRGFITKGDSNDYYDQASELGPPVRPDWIIGAARYRIPLGNLRS